MAFNVERRGVLKLMQGQRRSFGQLDRGGGQLGAAAQRSLVAETSEDPSSSMAGTGGGVSLDPSAVAEQGRGCYQPLRPLISNRVTTRLLTAPLQFRPETWPITALLADCPAPNPFFRPSGGK